MSRIYVASSWRNQRQPEVIAALRAEGHEAYDFRNPRPGETGFAWSEIDTEWQSWTPEKFRYELCHPIALRGFRNDFDAMQWADTGLLLLPCGRSAHLEAGYFVGARKRLIILLDRCSEPELMYRMAGDLCVSMDDVLRALGKP